VPSATPSSIGRDEHTPRSNLIRRFFVCPHRCALASQNAQHFQHLLQSYPVKTNHPRLRVLMLIPPARAHLRGHTSTHLIELTPRDLSIVGVRIWARRGTGQKSTAAPVMYHAMYHVTIHYRSMICITPRYIVCILCISLCQTVLCCGAMSYHGARAAAPKVR
jgi:hypothetical protein